MNAPTMPSSPPSRPAATSSHPQRFAGSVLALGCAGVVVVCALYLATPPEAIAPTLTIPAEARTAAVEGAGTMRWAGFGGLMGNPIMAVGALLLGIHAVLRDRIAAATGWFLIVMSLIVFIVVDAVVGFALSQAAAQPDGGFAALRSLFSALFLGGTAVFGAGAALAARELMAAGGLLGWASRIAVADGIAAAVLGAAGLAGLSAPQLTGATVGIGAAAFLAIGIGLATRPRPG